MRLEYIQTEQEMRDHEVPFLDKRGELMQYIESLEPMGDDYGKAAYTASLAATAAFKYMAVYQGLSGFQAGCADLDVIRRTRHWNCPFMLVKAEDLLYPQYDVPGKVQQWIAEQRGWLREKAKELLQKNKGMSISPNVKRHWEELAKDEEDEK